jgi:NADPH2:quinone reductase
MGDIANDGSKMLDTAENIFAKRIQPPRVTFFQLDTSFHKKPEISEFYAIVEKVRKGALSPVIAKLLPLSQGVEAHELIISGSAVKGKMLFVVDKDLANEHGL